MIRSTSNENILYTKLTNLGDSLYDALGDDEVGLFSSQNQKVVDIIIKFLETRAINIPLPPKTAYQWYRDKLVSLELVRELSINRHLQGRDLGSFIKLPDQEDIPKPVATMIITNYIKPETIESVTSLINIGNSENFAWAFIEYLESLDLPQHTMSDELFKVFNLRKDEYGNVYHHAIQNWSTELLRDCMLRLGNASAHERRRLIYESENVAGQTILKVVYSASKMAHRSKRRRYEESLWLLMYFSNDYSLTTRGSLVFVSATPQLEQKIYHQYYSLGQLEVSNLDDIHATSQII